MPDTLTTDQLVARVAPDDPDFADGVRSFVLRVHARGDTVLAYQNEDLTHPDLGHWQVLSYGSPQCQLEAAQFPEPPTRLPDIGTAINWRYILQAISPPA